MEKVYRTKLEELEDKCNLYIHKMNLIPKELINEVEEYATGLSTILAKEWVEWYKKYNKTLEEYFNNNIKE